MMDMEDKVPFCVLCGYYDWSKKQDYSGLPQYSNSELFPARERRSREKPVKAN
jgi:hypothetical protein